MGGRFFLLGILLFAFLRISGQMDGVHLRIQLHPVQILSIGGSQQSVNSADQKYITVSSTTGFEVNVNHRTDESGYMNVINSNKGAVHKDFVIDYNNNRISREIYADRSLKSTDLILTLISQ
jgi:hypothetical protein